MSDTHKKLQVIGAGKMGQALVAGLLRTDWATPTELLLVEVDTARQAQLVAQYPGISVTAEPEPDVDSLLAVKPYTVLDVCRTLRPSRLISVAAGITIGAIQDVVGQNTTVLRVMPNTPALIAKGVSGLAASSSAADEDIDWATQILTSVGQVVVVDETKIDAVTGLSGSGPAYIFAVAEALVEAGKGVGLAQETAETLAYQTLYGAASLLHRSDLGPADLRAQVTTPGGTTEAGLNVLADEGLEDAFRKAVASATERSVELGRS